MERRASFASEETERHEQAVKRFRSLCDMHKVPYGSAEDLRGFAEHLSENRHLAMDFWALVGELSGRERGALSDEEMLSVVVEGVSGHSVEELPPDAAEPSNRMRQMLAGVDVGGPTLPDPIADHEDELLSLERISTAKTSHSPEAAADRTHTQRMIADALLKLEDTARELREHLATIEHEKAQRTTPPTKPKTEEVVLQAPAEDASPKMDRVEPPPSSRTTPEAIKPLISYLENAARSANQTAAPAPNESVVFALRPADQLSQRGFAPSDQEDDPSIAVPLATYSSEKQRRKTFFLVTLPGMLLLVSGVWFAIGHGYARTWADDYGPSLHKKLELFRQEIRDLKGEHPTPAPEQQSPAPAAAQAPASSSFTPAIAPNADAGQDASQQSAAMLPTPDQQTAQPALAPGEDTSQSATPPGSVPHVSSAIMQANLLSSRLPAYPERARRMGVEGTVTVEVLISKTGVVQRVHVLRGDSQLRMAAIDAVLRWRYKPYMQSGRPVAIITQVNVPFQLSRR